MAIQATGKLDNLIKMGGTPLSFYKVEFYGTDIVNVEMSLCKAVSFPGSKRNTVDFFYNGVKYPIPREHQHAQTIEMTFYQDTQDSLRSKFLSWLRSGKDATNTSARVFQYRDKSLDEDALVTKYELKNIFATDVSDVRFGYDKAAEIGEFTVTLGYSIMVES